MNDILAEDFERIAPKLPPSVSRLAGKAVLITGARGLIGAYLSHLLVWLDKNVFSLYGHTQRCIQVFGVDSGVAAGGQAEPRSPVYLSYHPAYLHEVLGYRPDFVVHLASIASPKLYKKHPVDVLEANVNATWELCRYAATHRVVSMIVASSSEIYGNPTVIPTPETYVGAVNTLGPRSSYDESKRMAETLSYVYHQQHGVPVKIIRPSNVYGPGHSLEDGRIIPQIMKAAVRKEPLRVFGDGSATRSFCYLSDAVLQILWVMLEGKNGEAYNIGNGETETSMLALAEMAVLDLPIPGIKRVDDSTAMQDAPTRRCPDMTKLLTLGCPAAEVTLRGGLERTYQWHSEEGR